MQRLILRLVLAALTFLIGGVLTKVADRILGPDHKIEARQNLLKQELRDLRKRLDLYASDKQRLPSSLEDLVKANYVTQMPVDPMTGNGDWAPVMGDDPFGAIKRQGVVDVHSKAEGKDRSGVAYREY